MRTAILGAGNVGGALGRMWASKGHEVTFGVPNPNSDRVRALSKELGGRAKAASNADAVSGRDVVVLSVPWDTAEEALRASGDLSGRTLIDCTNPLSSDLKGLVIGNTWSAGEQVAAWTKAKVVKAFNTIGATNYARADFGGIQADGFYCGDDPAAKTVAKTLISDTGLHPVDVGPLRNARLLEPLATLWIDLAVNQGWGTDHAFKLLRRAK